jgi:addiction module HigA family antidote
MAHANVKDTSQYQPDYAVPPGEILADILDDRQMSHAEFARRCGRSGKLISEIISGKAPIEPSTALQFERVLDMAAKLWLNLDAAHQLHRAREEDDASIRQQEAWACRFPIKNLLRLRVLERPVDKVDAARNLLRLFGVGSIKAWEDRYGQLSVNFRRSTAFEGSVEALITWLRVGELFAERQHCAEFDRTRFLHALQDAEALTRRQPEEAEPALLDLCNQAGVAYVLFPALDGTHVSGAARWLTPRKALIQQSDRHKTADHFWFTFFHEAAHLLLHSKREVFVDERDGPADQEAEEEVEANAWAGDRLVPEAALARFTGQRRISREKVLACARDFDIEPGILVGRLQHERILAWKNLNDLKRRVALTRADGTYTLASRAS